MNIEEELAWRKRRKLVRITPEYIIEALQKSGIVPEGVVVQGGWLDTEGDDFLIRIWHPSFKSGSPYEIVKVG